MTDVGTAAAVLFREAALLDKGAWTDWVDMYEPDAVFWVPSWRDEYDTTDDPRREVSLIYHDERRGLEERIARIESRKSITALPLPRTLHQVGNVHIVATGAEGLDVESVAAVHVYDPRTMKEHTRYARYEHRLVPSADAGDWRIARKKITLVNDRIPTVLDFYSI